jgi:ABC-type lipopolysaccharide export system ATPase subunit
MPKLLVDSVRVRFGNHQVLSGGYITSSTGKVTGLLGRNGAGKSCMFRALMGGLRAEHIFVKVDDKPLTSLNRIGLSVKYLCQGRLIPEEMSLKKAFALYDVDFWKFASAFPKYSAYYHEPLWMLSGGEARIAEIWLVLHSKALFCILDEPFSQIDPVYIEKVRSLIREQSAGKGIIVTDHNYGSVSMVCDDMFVIADGYTLPVRSREDLVRYGYLSG